MVNKIFAKNIKIPESNDLSVRFVRLESAYSNTISDVAMGAASGLSDHDFSFSAVFTHIYIWDVKWPEAAGTGRLFKIPDDMESVNMLISPTGQPSKRKYDTRHIVMKLSF